MQAIHLNKRKPGADKVLTYTCSARNTSKLCIYGSRGAHKFTKNVVHTATQWCHFCRVHLHAYVDAASISQASQDWYLTKKREDVGNTFLFGCQQTVDQMKFEGSIKERD